MTTTTRTTRKAPWAVVLTALLAVLGMVFGVLAFAAPATAGDDSGHSPAAECVDLDGYIGFDKIEFDDTTPSESGGASGGASITYTTDANGGWTTTLLAGRVVVKTGTSTPGVTGVPGYSGTWTTGGQQLSHITFCYVGETPPETCPADAAVHAGEVIPEGQTAETYCTLPPPERCPADAAVHAGEVIPEGQTAETYCTLPPPPPPPRCASDAAVHAGEVIPEGQTAETYCTLPPPPPTEPEPVSVVQPATVEEPVVEEPETVAVPAPATVPVPTAPVLPATIPAGSGLTIPVYALALLALGATALAATTVHLVRTTR